MATHDTPGIHGTTDAVYAAKVLLLEYVRDWFALHPRWAGRLMSDHTNNVLKIALVGSAGGAVSVSLPRPCCPACMAKQGVEVHRRLDECAFRTLIGIGAPRG